jgi:hypothetical protein
MGATLEGLLPQWTMATMLSWGLAGLRALHLRVVI